jgi:hypothetical protein
MPLDPKPPLGLMNLPKGWSLGGWKDYQKPSNGNGSLSSSHQRPFFLFSSSFCLFSFFFSFFLPFLLLLLLFYYFYPFFSSYYSYMVNMVGSSSPYLYFTFKLKP